MVELRAEHFSDTDRDTLIVAGQTLMAWARDWSFHEAADGVWFQGADEDPLETTAHLRHILADAARALAETRRLLNVATSSARRRALAEQRRQQARR